MFAFFRSSGHSRSGADVLYCHIRRSTTRAFESAPLAFQLNSRRRIMPQSCGKWNRRLGEKGSRSTSPRFRPSDRRIAEFRCCSRPSATSLGFSRERSFDRLSMKRVCNSCKAFALLRSSNAVKNHESLPGILGERIDSSPEKIISSNIRDEIEMTQNLLYQARPLTTLMTISHENCLIIHRSRSRESRSYSR